MYMCICGAFNVGTDISIAYIKAPSGVVLSHDTSLLHAITKHLLFAYMLMQLVLSAYVCK